MAADPKPQMPMDLKLMMEKIRERAGQIASWTDLLKAAKINMMEKVNNLEASDREELRECLESLQKTQKLTSAKEVFAQLKELAVTKCGGLARFKIRYNVCMIPKPEEATHLKLLINESRWEDVVQHLKSLSRFYPDDTMGKIETSRKQDTFKSLQFLEKDIWSLLPSIKSISMDNLEEFLELPLGVMRQREAGQPMRLSYFLSPYDLIDVKAKDTISLSVSEIVAHLPLEMNRHSSVLRAGSVLDVVERDWDSSVDIVIGNCPSGCALPSKSLRQKSKPGFLELSSENSHTLPATFIAEFQKPVCVLKTDLNDVLKPGGDSSGSFVENEEGNMLRWIIEEKRDPHVAAHKGLLTTLKEQRHSYVMDWRAHSHLAGVKVKRVPFSHPRELMGILRVLRRELLTAAVMGSCVRDGEDQDSDTPGSIITFQLSFPNRETADCLFDFPVNQGSIFHAQFRYPDWQRMAVELKVSCGTSTGPNSNFKQLEKKLTRVFQKSWSIPVTLRCLILELESSLPNPGSEPMDTSKSEVENNPGSSSSEGENGPEWMRRVNETDRFFLLNQGNGEHSAGKKSSAWCPSYKSPLYSSHVNGSAQTDKITCTVEPVGDPRYPPNLLNLFKEIQTVDELIPPRANQPPLKSPTPVTVSAQSSKLQEMLGTPAVGSFPLPPPPMTIPNSGGAVMQSQGIAINRTMSRGRHLSSSSDTFGELESILQMSKSLTSEQHQHIGTAAAGRGEAGCGIAGAMEAATKQMRRAASVHEAMEGGVAEGGSFSPSSGSQGEPSPVLAAGSMVPPLGPGASPHPSASSTPSSIFPPNPRFMHSRSFDIGMYPPGIQGQQPYPTPPFPAGPRPMSASAAGRGIDEFDFEKSDPVEAGMFKYRTMGETVVDAGSISASPYFGSGAQGAFPFNQLPASGPGSRGGKIPRGGGSRRRSKKSPGNVGDRQQSRDGSSSPGTSTKKRGGNSGTRRPRKQRGGAMLPPPTSVSVMQQMIPADAAQVPASAQLPPVLTEQIPKLMPAATTSSIFPNMNSPHIHDSNFGKLGSSFPDPFAVEGPVSTAGEKVKSHTDAHIGLEIEDSDDSDSQSGDAHLRKQIQDVLSGSRKPSPPVAKLETKLSEVEEKHMPAGNDNLFENLQSHAESQNVISSGPNLSGPGMVNPRPKPNILLKTAGRKGSLDMVIGKLRDKVGGSSGADDEEDDPKELVARRARAMTLGGDLTDPLVDSVFGAYTPAELAQVQALKQAELPGSDQGSSTGSPSDSEGIKVVIKKNLIKQTQEKMAAAISGAKYGLSKQKSTESKQSKGTGSKDEVKSRPKEKKKKDDKFAALKAEVSKKRKYEETAVPKSVSKSEKQLLSPGAKMPKLPQQESPVHGLAGDPKFPGSEGILFSSFSSLRGFKIPKLQEEMAPQIPAPAPPPVPVPAPPQTLPKFHSESGQSNKQFLQQKKSVDSSQGPPKVLKSIMKQSSKPPVLQPEILSNFRPMGRKGLLPRPPMQKEMIEAYVEPFGIGGEVQDAPTELSSDGLQIRSPDPDSGFEIDETKSPTGLNLSKDSDMSPELKIDTDVVENLDS